MAADGQQFGKYRLLRRIASGGMGEVHLAKLVGPSGFEKLVVIKRLLEHRLREKKYVDMFFGEARVAAQLSHSNIVQVYEVGELEDTPYIAMEYVHGKSLRKLLDTAQKSPQESHKGRIPPGYVAQIFSQLCFGLSFAHNARHHSGAPMELIHRDVNPLNVLISYQGEIKVIDFGIAKTELTLEKTQVGTIKGTVVYMSPEQSLGHRLDKRSDLFSVGICLYEALTGKNPFHKQNLATSLDAIRGAVVEPIEVTHPQLAPFAPLLQQSLARRREDRFSDCQELGEALLALVERGEVARPTLPLAVYMSEMFSRDIRDERSALERTDMFELTETSGPHAASMSSEAVVESDAGAPGGTRPSLRATKGQPSLAKDAAEEGVLFGTRTDAVDLPPDIIAQMAAEEHLRTGEEVLPAEATSRPEATRIETFHFGNEEPTARGDYEPAPAPKHDTFVGPYSDVDMKIGEAIAARSRAGLGPVAKEKKPNVMGAEETMTPNPVLILLRPLVPRLSQWARTTRGGLESLFKHARRLPILKQVLLFLEPYRTVLAGVMAMSCLLGFVLFISRMGPRPDTQAPDFVITSEPTMQGDVPESAVPDVAETAPAAEPPPPTPKAAAPAAPSNQATPAPAQTPPGASAPATPPPAQEVPRRMQPMPQGARHRHASASARLLAGPHWVHIDTDPQVSMRVNGTLIDDSVSLSRHRSILQIGDNAETDPFIITMHISLSASKTNYMIDAQPYAQVFGPGGIALGRTPLTWSSTTQIVALEFKNPRRNTSQRITLRHLSEREASAEAEAP